MEGTRELPLPPLPFVVVYRLRGEAVEIARVLHGAQRWP
jgi:plasmid stabilization system protein ParE